MTANGPGAGARRVQVHDLTRADFAEHPIWELATDEEGVDGQDEATARPYPPGSAGSRGHGGLLVATEFQLADGTLLPGFLTPQPAAHDLPGWTQPTMILPDGQLNPWSGMRRWTETAMAEALARLRRSAEAVFPIRYQTTAAMEDGAVTGSLPGFLHLEAGRPVWVWPGSPAQSLD